MTHEQYLKIVIEDHVEYWTRPGAATHYLEQARKHPDVVNEKDRAKERAERKRERKAERLRKQISPARWVTP